MTSPWPAPNPNPLPNPPCVDIPTVYRRAAEVIDIKGWAQGTMRDAEGRVCAVGALRIAAGLPARVRRVSDDDEALESASIQPLHDHVGALVTVWNDAPGRTEAEVKDALRAVAAKYEAELAVAFRRPPGWRAS